MARDSFDPPPSRLPGVRARWPELLALIAVLVAAAAVRLAPWRSARDGDAWLLADGDSYYHMRRIEQTIAAGGRVPMFDPWLSYPEGQRIQWHAGFDLLAAGAAVAACGIAPERQCMETAAVLVVPLLGVAAALAVFWMALALLGPRGSLLAAALFALYPFSAGAARIGHVDHHVLEPLLVALWFGALLRGRPRAAGIVAGLAFACFPSALLAVGATCAGLAVARLAQLRPASAPDASASGRPAERERRTDFSALWFIGVTWLVALPVVLTGGFADRFEPAATSLFHLVALTFGAALLGAIELAPRLAPRRPRAAALGLCALIAGIGAAAGSTWLLPLIRFGRVAGLWTGVVQQVSLGRGPLAQTLLAGALAASCWLGWLRWRRPVPPAAGGRGPAPAVADGRSLAVAALLLGLAGIEQIRFLMMASPLIVCVVAHATITLPRALARRLATAPARTRTLGALVGYAAASLVAVPLFEYLHGAPRPPVFRRTARLLRRFGRRADRAEHPPRAVLSDWTWGHHVLYLARLPTVASPFILSGSDRANVEARRALLGRDLDALLALMTRRRCRYLLITELFDPALAATSLGVVLPKGRGHDALARRLLRTEVEHIGGPLRLAASAPGVRLFERVSGDARAWREDEQELVVRRIQPSQSSDP